MARTNLAAHEAQILDTEVMAQSMSSLFNLYFA